MAGIAEVISIGTFLCGIPRPCPGAVSIGERHHVINVQVARISEFYPCIGPDPCTGCYLAIARGFEGDRRSRLGDEGFLACILTITIFVYPLPPRITIVCWYITGHFSLSGQA